MCPAFRRTHLISISNCEKLIEKREITELKKYNTYF